MKNKGKTQWILSSGDIRLLSMIGEKDNILHYSKKTGLSYTFCSKSSKKLWNLGLVNRNKKGRNIILFPTSDGRVFINFLKKLVMKND